MEKIKNAVPKRYRAYHITPGVADYTEDAQVQGRVLIQKQTLDKMQSSFVGKPVVNFQHTDKDPDELFQSLKNGADPEEFADGVISAVGYDDASGWYWADMIIWDQETLENIDKGYSVSCAYDVTELDDTGGTFSNVDYVEEVLDGEYVHMAIVPNPRYERAYIIKNSKGEQMATFRFGKKTVKNAPPLPPDKKPEEEEVIENADGVVDIDGEQVPLAELIKVYQAEQAEGGGATMLNEDDEVDLGEGKKAKVGDMVNAYRNRKNGAAPEEELKNEAGLLDESAEKVVGEGKQVQNAKADKGKENFNRVKNAANGSDPGKPIIRTKADRFELGKARYGTPVAQGGNK